MPRNMRPSKKMAQALLWVSAVSLILIIDAKMQVVNVETGIANQKVVLKLGDTFEVKVKGNPTTGFSWAVAPMADDASVEQAPLFFGHCRSKWLELPSLADCLH